MKFEYSEKYEILSKLLSKIIHELEGYVSIDLMTQIYQEWNMILIF